MIYKTVIETTANTKFDHGPFGSYEGARNFAVRTAKMSGVTKVTILDSNGKLVAVADANSFVGESNPIPSKESVMYGKAIPPVPVKSETSTPKTKSTAPSKEATMNRYVEETNNKRSNVSFILLMLLGALISSASWGGALYGPDAVNNIVKWWNAPPELSELGQKISSMLDNEDEWEQIYGDTLKHKQKGFTITPTSSGVILFDDTTVNVSECLTNGDASWLLKKVTPLVKSFVAAAKAKDDAILQKKLDDEKAALLKKLSEEKAALLKKLK